jgi:hypothetical protein
VAVNDDDLGEGVLVSLTSVSAINMLVLQSFASARRYQFRDDHVVTWMHHVQHQLDDTTAEARKLGWTRFVARQGAKAWWPFVCRRRFHATQGCPASLILSNKIPNDNLPIAEFPERAITYSI